MAKSPYAPYIVLIGGTGTGKSTIVEKLTKKKGTSSISIADATKDSQAFYVPEGTLIVADTPGNNQRKDKLQRNVCIAGALNYRPVSQIFIVVRAEPRIDFVIDSVGSHADNFVDLPLDLLSVLVTHKDIVKWEEHEFRMAVNNDFAIKKVVFSGISTDRKTILANILETCDKEYNLTVNGENFLKLFKIHNRDRNLLCSTKSEIEEFRRKKIAFNEEIKAYKGKDEVVDLAFEFQQYMTDEIYKAQMRVSEKHFLTFHGEFAATEAGYIATMTNQLRLILYSIRVECLKYQSESSAKRELNTDDIKELPPTASHFEKKVSEMISSAKIGMTLSPL